MKRGFVALCIILISCGKKDSVPGDYIQPAKMQLVLWDYIRADALTTQKKKAIGSTDAWIGNIELQKQVFAIHKVTKEGFYKSLDYYEKHPQIMKTMMDSIAEKATRERINHVPLNPVNPVLAQ